MIIKSIVVITSVNTVRYVAILVSVVVVIVIEFVNAIVIGLGL